jgi:hypothetical protein
MEDSDPELRARSCAEMAANTPLLADTVLPQVLAAVHDVAESSSWHVRATVRPRPPDSPGAAPPPLQLRPNPEPRARASAVLFGRRCCRSCKSSSSGTNSRSAPRTCSASARSCSPCSATPRHARARACARVLAGRRGAERNCRRHRSARRARLGTHDVPASVPGGGARDGADRALRPSAHPGATRPRRPCRAHPPGALQNSPEAGPCVSLEAGRSAADARAGGRGAGGGSCGRAPRGVCGVGCGAARAARARRGGGRRGGGGGAHAARGGARAGCARGGLPVRRPAVDARRANKAPLCPGPCLSAPPDPAPLHQRRALSLSLRKRWPARLGTHSPPSLLPPPPGNETARGAALRAVPPLAPHFAPGREASGWQGCGAGGAPPPLVLSGHAASLSPY